MKPTNRYSAMLVVRDSADVEGIRSVCLDSGIQLQVLDDPQDALGICRVNPPNLAIVQDELKSMSGLEFISALVRMSWTTSVIIVMDADPETVHDRTEGLGILGHMEHLNDMERLKGHLETFVDIMASTASPE